MNKMILYTRMSQKGDIELRTEQKNNKFYAIYDNIKEEITLETFNFLTHLRDNQRIIEEKEKQLKDFKELLESKFYLVTDFNYTFDSKEFRFFAKVRKTGTIYEIDYSTFNLCTNFVYAGKILK